MHVFTYGSLMFPEIWQAVVVGREFETIEGTVSGYSVYRVRRGAYPGMIASAAENIVRGRVYLDVDSASVARLDRFEGRFYERLTLPVTCTDGQQRMAAAYVVPKRHDHGLTSETWTAEEFVASGGIVEFTRRFHGFSRLDAEG
jgi:gamma-glutamylcyclotransferase (GGCT)/AIG2-like uncharacterized protein YtfP